jgi:hypothetical protein
LVKDALHLESQFHTVNPIAHFRKLSDEEEWKYWIPHVVIHIQKARHLEKEFTLHTIFGWFDRKAGVGCKPAEEDTKWFVKSLPLWCNHFTANKMTYTGQNVSDMRSSLLLLLNQSFSGCWGRSF